MCLPFEGGLARATRIGEKDDIPGNPLHFGNA